MSEIEEFLASQNKCRCERMNAYLTEQQCKSNQKSGRYISCSGCPGLGGEIEMSKAHRGTCPLCKREDVLLISKNGECHRCYKRGAKRQNPLDTNRPMPAAPAKKEKKVDVHIQPKIDHKAVCIESIKPKIDNKSIRIPPPEVTAPALKVETAFTEQEIHIINLIDVFKQKQAAELEEFIMDLSKQPSPYEKLMFAYGKVKHG